ncbi:glucoside xylosyltransferase 2-like [Limulus polyphemus]|uniref:UDP-D-xylose:beta-D-glucoside alpha-1,3-D-xylosyltransferase n=1 Tax=Limulus polyphemus TaxID=6850 RepID=A0ABM1SIT7_LIMPO|nr:glucoside xylosyltransferase 2-like [Limulus polyphemus]
MWPRRPRLRTRTLIYAALINSFIIVLLKVILKRQENGSIETERALYRTPAKQHDTVHVASMWKSPLRFVEGTIYIATSVCGNRLAEALVMIKSVFIFTETPTHFIFFTELELRPPLERQLKIWQRLQPNISYTFRLASYPASANESSWKLLYRPCSTLKLFLPDLLTELDAVLVLDTDVLFLRSPKGFWAHLYQMRPFHLMGLSEETPSASLGWYPNHVSAFKIYEDKGVNGGIWLMNLTRLRQHNFTREVLHIYDQYGEHIDFGDQDVVSIFYGRRPVFNMAVVEFPTKSRQCFCTGPQVSGSMMPAGEVQAAVRGEFLSYV